jgi:PKD repeat protein
MAGRWLCAVLVTAAMSAPVAVVAAAPSASAAPAPRAGISALDPGAYSSGLGPLTTSSGHTLSFDTATGSITDNGAPVRPAGAGVINGIGVTTNVNGSGITGFYTNGITIPAGATATYTGPYALGLLSTGNVTVGGQIAAGQGSGPGLGTGAGGAGTCSGANSSGGGGGGFGATGGQGGSAPGALPGAAGASFGQGDLTTTPISVGSGGGAGKSSSTCQVRAGGAGGGTVGMYAYGTVDLSGAFVAAAGSAGTANACSSGSGGGAGGGFVVVAPGYVDNAFTTFKLLGGAGGAATACGGAALGGGAAGGGGRMTMVRGGTRAGGMFGVLPQGGLGAGAGGGGASGSAASVYERSFVTAGNDSGSVADVGASIAFSAAVEFGTVAGYQWDFGDGTSTSTVSGAVDHTYAQPGHYVITATVTMAGTGTISIGTTSVDIADVAISGLTAANSSPTPAGLATALTASVTTGTNITYSWDFGDGQQGAGPTVHHKYKTAGPYTATVTATNSTNSVFTTTDVTITDPVLSVGDASVVEGTSPPDPKATIVTVAVSLSAPTSHDVTVTVSTQDGTAHAPGDYQSLVTSVTVRAGRKLVRVKLKVAADTLPEPDEQFEVNLTSPIGAAIRDGIGKVVIVDDD